MTFRRLGAVILLILTTVPARGMEPASAAFERVPCDEQVTTATLSEDGSLLFAAHGEADRVSVWDVKTGRLLKRIECPSPHFLLSRGHRLFVASAADRGGDGGGRAALRAFDGSPEWAAGKVVPLETHEIAFLSAARGQFFNGTVLATSGTDVNRRQPVFAVDTLAGTGRQVGETPRGGWATVTNTGTTVLLQARHARPVVRVTSEFVRGVGADVAEGNRPADDWVRQSPTGDVWMDNRSFHVGLPPAPTFRNATGFLAPDEAAPLAYDITPTAVSIYRLDAGLQDPAAARFAVEFPPDAKLAFAGPSGQSIINTAVVLDGEAVFRPSMAVTRGGELFLYVYAASPDTRHISLYRCATKAFPPPPPSAAQPSVIAFTTLPTSDYVHQVELTEDGQFLLTVHPAEDKVTAWDVATGAPAATMTTSSPVHVLSRGGRVYIANHDKGTVSVFSQSPDWKLVDELAVGAPGCYHLAAGAGERFQGRLLVSAPDSTNAEITRGFLLDVERDESLELPGTRGDIFLGLDYAGDMVIRQQPAKTMLDGWAKLETFVRQPNSVGPLFDNRNHDQVPYLQQHHEGGAWVGGRGVYVGGPPRLARDWLGAFVVADRSARVVYGILRDEIRAFTADANATLVGARQALVPSAFATVAASAAESRKRLRGADGDDERSPGFRRGSRRGALAHAAVTREGRTHLFLLHPVSGVVYQTSFDPFPATPPPATATTAPSTTHPSPPTSAATAEPAFVRVPLPDAVTAFTATEDGRHVLFAFESSGRVSVWDVTAGRLVKDIACAAPRYLLSRGDMLYVADPTAGCIRTFSRGVDWAATEEIEVAPGVGYLSAASGDNFDGSIIATADAPGGRGAYLVEVKHQRTRHLVSREHLGAASVSADGALLVLQGPFAQSSPRGKPEVIRLTSLLRDGPSAIATSAHENSDLLFQAPAGGPLWFDGRQLLSGRPPATIVTRVPGTFGSIVGTFPDLLRPVHYVVDVEGSVAVRSSDASLAELDRVRVALPEPLARVAREPTPEERSKAQDGIGVGYSKPLGVTVGGQTFLFVGDGRGDVYAAAIPATASHAALARDTPSEVPPDGLPLLTPDPDVSYGVGRRTLLVVEGRSLRVLSGDARRILRSVALPSEYRQVRERPGHYLALSESSLDLLDRETLRLLKTVPLPGVTTGMMAPHPAEPVTYVSYAGTLPAEGKERVGWHVVAVDERIGKLTLIRNVFAPYLGLDASGRHLFAVRTRNGYRGAQLGHRVLEASLQTYGLAGARAATKPPGGVVLEEDAAVASLLLEADPGTTGALTTLDAEAPHQLAKRFKAYASGNDVRGISFHPTSPVVALMSSDTVWLSRNKSGKRLDGLLKLGTEPLAEARQVLFSPDGSSVLVEYRRADGRRALRAFAVDLSGVGAHTASAAAATAADPGGGTSAAEPVAAANVRDTGRGSSPRAKRRRAIEALEPGDRGDERELKEIAREAQGVVVGVKAGVGRLGAGVFVGSDGYVLTSADAVVGHGDRSPLVDYLHVRKTDGATIFGGAVLARVLAIDEQRNLALIKIPVDEPVPTVHLSRKGPETADRVAAVGATGSWEADSAFELRSGRVSNKGRVVHGLPRLQLDLVVPPYFSGAPLLDMRGELGGVVTGSASGVEKVTLAVPLTEVRSFLEERQVPRRAPARPPHPAADRAKE